MSDEPADVQSKQPPVSRTQQVDQGLLAWAKTFQAAIENQQGVEIIASTGASTHFRFRGQTFSVTVQRTS